VIYFNRDLARFTCQLPVKIPTTLPASLTAAKSEISDLRHALADSKVMIFSPMNSTRNLLSNTLRALTVEIALSLEDIKHVITSAHRSAPPRDGVCPRHFDVVILDCNPSDVQDIILLIQSSNQVRKTSVVHISAYNSSMLEQPISIATHISPVQILRVNKPIRPLHLLRTLVQLRNMTITASRAASPSPMSTLPISPVVRVAGPKLIDTFTHSQRDVFKTTHVLIAEGGYLNLFKSLVIFTNSCR
jgi:hypothetical protein